MSKSQRAFLVTIIIWLAGAIGYAISLIVTGIIDVVISVCFKNFSADTMTILGLILIISVPVYIFFMLIY